MLPDKFECRMANGPGIAGLGAGIRWIVERGIESLRAAECELTAMLIEGLGQMPGVTVFGPSAATERTAVVSFRAADKAVSEIGQRLDEDHTVLCRVGLHCAPAAHHSLGTFPEGTVRLAPGPLTTAGDVAATIKTVAQVIQG
jgi:selenocysteine lyase/cysteine desulfurase